MSGILFSRGQALQSLALADRSVAFGLVLGQSSALLTFATRSIATRLALGASNARLILTHV
jgi:hypothetical protein